MPLGRVVGAPRRAVAHLQLSLAGFVALLVGAGVCVASAAVFAGATEDVTQHNGLALHDATRLRLFVDHRDAFVVHAANVATTVGSVPVVAVIAVSAALLLWWRGARLAIALAPVASLAVSATAVSIVKTVVGRGRPPVALHLVSESDASFPSGHATNSSAVFMTVALVIAVFVLRRSLARAATVVAAGIMAAAVGASRLVLGVHWPSDVVAGMALGCAVALGITMTAAIVTRLAPRPPSTEDGHARKAVHRVQGWLALERRPRPDLRAA